MIAHYLRRGRKTASGFTAGGRAKTRLQRVSERIRPDKHLPELFPLNKPRLLCTFTLFAAANHFFLPSRSTGAHKYGRNSSAPDLK